MENLSVVQVPENTQLEVEEGQPDQQLEQAGPLSSILAAQSDSVDSDSAARCLPLDPTNFSVLSQVVEQQDVLQLHIQQQLDEQKVSTPTPEGIYYEAHDRVTEGVTPIWSLHMGVVGYTGVIRTK